MKTVTLVEFRKNAEGILRQVQQGQSLILTCRGRPTARLEPIEDMDVRADDPIYHLDSFASGESEALSNEDMDRVIYGS